jgi:hypothetical protein
VVAAAVQVFLLRAARAVLVARMVAAAVAVEQATARTRSSEATAAQVAQV